MSKKQTSDPKYVVHHAEQSAIGDYVHVENVFPAPQAATDPGMAELSGPKPAEAA